MSEFSTNGIQPENPEHEKINKYFESIVKVLVSEVKGQLTRAYLEADSKKQDFLYNGLTLDKLRKQIEEVKPFIIRPSDKKTSVNQMYPKEFALNFGLSESQYEEIISRYL